MMNQLSKAVTSVRLSSFIADVASLMTSRVAVMGISFFSGIIMARQLGPDNKGVVTALLVIPSLIQLFAELGLRQSTVYYLGKRIFDDQAVISTVSFLILLISCGGTALVTASYVLSGLPDRYGWDVTTIPLLLLPCSLVISYGSGILMAKQQIRSIAIISVLEPLVILCLYGILLVLSIFTIKSVLWVMVIAAAAAALYTITLVLPYGSIRPRYIAGIPVQFIKKGFVYALALFIINLGYRIDILLLERMTSAREVGIYAVGVGLAQLLWLPTSALATVNFARGAAANDANKQAQKTALMMRYSLWGSLAPCVMLYFAAPWLILLIYGDAYAGSGAVVQAILLGVWSDLIFKLLNSDLAGRGIPQAALWVSGFALVINVALNVMWIPAFGGVGAAWASSVSYTIGALIFAWTYAKISNLNPWDLLIPRKTELRGLAAKLHI